MRSQIKRLVRQCLPRTQRAHRIWTGPLKGKVIVTSWRDYPAAILGYGEANLTTWLQKTAKTGETWIDVGAHYGYTSLALCGAVGETGRVFAFEPSMTSAGCLARTRLLNGIRSWTICPFGLDASDALRPNELLMSRGMIDSQLRLEDADATERFFTIAFDRAWPLLCGDNPRVDGVKIDVQGMELSVLSGMIGCLSRDRPKLVVEMHAGVSRADLKAILHRGGYAVNEWPIENGAPALDDEGGNASYVFGA